MASIMSFSSVMTLGHTWANLDHSLVLHTGKHRLHCPDWRSRELPGWFPHASTSFITCTSTRSGSIFLFARPPATPLSGQIATGVFAWRRCRARLGGDSRWQWASCRIRSPRRSPGRARFAGRCSQRRLPAARCARGTSRPRHRRRDSAGRSRRSWRGRCNVTSPSDPVHAWSSAPAGADPYLAVAISRFPRHYAVHRRRDRARLGVRSRPRDPSAAIAARCSDVPLIGFHLVDAIRAGRSASSAA